MYLLVIDHPDSLERIERDGQIVKVIGKGLMKSPGHPAGNQQYHRQTDFIIEATKKPYLFPVFNKDSYGRLEYLGDYKYMDMKIKIAFAGFRYFEFTMVRVNRSKPGEEREFPPV